MCRTNMWIQFGIYYQQVTFIDCALCIVLCYEALVLQTRFDQSRYALQNCKQTLLNTEHFYWILFVNIAEYMPCLQLRGNYLEFLREIPPNKKHFCGSLCVICGNPAIPRPNANTDVHCICPTSATARGLSSKNRC